MANATLEAQLELEELERAAQTAPEATPPLTSPLLPELTVNRETGLWSRSSSGSGRGCKPMASSSCQEGSSAGVWLAF